MSNRKRLIVCLDGTWNREDDSTNVLHQYNLVIEGMVPTKDGGSILQKKHYFRGVGTGPLDRITGGGFGFGLEQNVRDAYNWLVEQYNDGCQNPADADEIYIFGFSRGAYTARSLVGFISSYGILRRGAPLTVNQLWSNYCIRGRRMEHRKDIWESVFGKDEKVPRRISELVIDPWLRGRGAWGNRPVAREQSDSERLIVDWSRRAKITYLGIYETVGALGWDALAIPGLRSRMALHHNMRPTTIIQKCHHALAIHEHRSSFRHTPFIAYLGDVQSKREATDSVEEVDRAHRHPAEAMWSRKIKQRWFAGAHSNLGGGYEDNLLAQRPLAWIMEGAAGEGLVSEPVPAATLPVYPKPLPRDSYSEFASPFWTMILRAKRNYRRMTPPPEYSAAGEPDDASDEPKPGFVLKHINEWLDESVFTYFNSPKSQPPPNLVEYARRLSPDAPANKQEKLNALAQAKPAHSWPGGGKIGIVATFVWAAAAAYGIVMADGIFLLFWGQLPVPQVILWGMLMWLMVDFWESRVNFSIALHGGGSVRRSVKAVLYWLRSVGCILFAVSAIAFFIAIGAWLWSKFSLWTGSPGGSGPGGPGGPTSEMHTAGLLLLLQAGLGFLLKAASWNGEPMAKVNLPSVVGLQFCPTPGMAKACLDRWVMALKPDRNSLEPDFKKRALEPVRESLWRDICGFIPLYTLVLGFGSWFASTQFEPGFWTDFWFLFPITAAIADYVEDASQFRVVSLYLHGKQPSQFLTVTSFVMSMIKFAAFAAQALLTLSVLIKVSYALMLNPAPAGLRGVLAASISGLTVLAVAGVAIWAAIYRLQNRTNTETKPTSPQQPEEAVALA
jgi:uncharacterized protein (DUF2235 family)